MRGDDEAAIRESVEDQHAPGDRDGIRSRSPDAHPDLRFRRATTITFGQDTKDHVAQDDRSSQCEPGRGRNVTEENPDAGKLEAVNERTPTRDMGEYLPSPNHRSCLM